MSIPPRILSLITFADLLRALSESSSTAVAASASDGYVQLPIIVAPSIATLKYLPFDCGFFITIPCDNPDEVYKRLVEKKVHLIPMGNVIRATLSSISLEECKRLPKIIKECL